MRSSQRFKDARRSPSSAKRPQRNGADWKRRRPRWARARPPGYAAKPGAPRKSITSAGPERHACRPRLPFGEWDFSRRRRGRSCTHHEPWPFHSSHVWQEPWWRHLSSLSHPNRHLGFLVFETPLGRPFAALIRGRGGSWVLIIEYTRHVPRSGGQFCILGVRYLCTSGHGILPEYAPNLIHVAACHFMACSCILRSIGQSASRTWSFILGKARPSRHMAQVY